MNASAPAIKAASATPAVLLVKLLEVLKRENWAVPLNPVFSNLATVKAAVSETLEALRRNQVIWHEVECRAATVSKEFRDNRDLRSAYTQFFELSVAGGGEFVTLRAYPASTPAAD
jgi:hypothetical protein